jgi:N-acetylmuramoyl-L-alanine amidase
METGIAEATVMAQYHKVEQGEHLAKIAAKYGFADYMAIWNHAKNVQMKQKRQNPNVLFPGDILFIPDKQEKKMPTPTTQVHRFEVSAKTIMLRIVLKNMDGTPIANTKCELHVGGQLSQLTTSGEGKIEREIPIKADQARLVLLEKQPPFEMHIPVLIGHLDPEQEVSGQRARLNNLGYLLGPINSPNEAQFRSAVEEFQCDNGLRVSGVCDGPTQAKLRDAHGS